MRVVGDCLAQNHQYKHLQWGRVATKEATISEDQRLHKDFYFGVVLVKENQKFNNVKICIDATTI